jgi:hypothetical protein
VSRSSSYSEGDCRSHHDNNNRSDRRVSHRGASEVHSKLSLKTSSNTTNGRAHTYREGCVDNRSSVRGSVGGSVRGSGNDITHRSRENSISTSASTDSVNGSGTATNRGSSSSNRRPQILVRMQLEIRFVTECTSD